MNWFWDGGLDAIAMWKQAATQRARNGTAGLHLLWVILYTRVTCTCWHWKNNYIQNNRLQVLASLNFRQASDDHLKHSSPIQEEPPKTPPRYNINHRHLRQLQDSLRSMDCWKVSPHQQAIKCHQFYTSTIDTPPTVAECSDSPHSPWQNYTPEDY